MARDSTSSHDDDVASFQKTAIGTIAKHLFGHAILASVRKNAVLRRTLWEAFFCASIAAVVGRFQFGLPLLTCFLAILVLYAEAIAQVHYAELYDVYRKWTTIRRRVYLAGFIFSLLRFMVWKGFGIPPAEAYAAMARAGGFIHVFWYGNASAIVLLELELTFALGYVSCLIAFHKNRRAVSVAAALVAIAAVFWAMPLSDAELAEEGILGVVANRLGRLSGALPENSRRTALSDPRITEQRHFSLAQTHQHHLSTRHQLTENRQPQLAPNTCAGTRDVLPPDKVISSQRLHGHREVFRESGTTVGLTDSRRFSCWPKRGTGLQANIDSVTTWSPSAESYMPTVGST